MCGKSKEENDGKGGIHLPHTHTRVRPAAAAHSNRYYCREYHLLYYEFIGTNENKAKTQQQAVVIADKICMTGL